jgi:hypothetical protein
VDTVAPVAGTLALSNFVDSGSNSTDFITSDRTFDLSLSGQEAGAVVTYQKRVSGSWQTTTAAQSSLADGTHEYRAQVRDAAGNTSTSNVITVTVDNAPPSVTATVATYTDNVGAAQGNFGTGTTDDRQITLNGTLSGGLATGETVRVYDGTTFLGTATVSGTTWTFDTAALQDGTTYNFRATVADAAGNETAPSAALAVTVDIGVVVNAQTTFDTTPVITGSLDFALETGEYLEVTVNGVTYSSQDDAVVIDQGNRTWYVQIPAGNALPVGTYPVTATVRDAAAAVVTEDTTTNELVVQANNGLAATTQTLPSFDLRYANGMSATMDESGQLALLARNVLYRQTSSITAMTASTLTLTQTSATASGLGNTVASVTFVDFDRDTDLDIFASDANYGDFSQQIWVGDSGTGFTGARPSYETGFGTAGVIAIDTRGDGRVDVLYGDVSVDVSGFFNNTASTTSSSADLAAAAVPNSGVIASVERELSGVDLNNDGAIDVVHHTSGSTMNVGINNGSGSFSNSTVTNVFRAADGTIANGLSNAVSMTWADFDNDGDMDLYLNRSTNSGTATDESFIYQNQGGATPFTSTGRVGLGDALQGGGSVAVDWNGDGKMDVIELPTRAVTGNIQLYTNTNSAAGTISFSATPTALASSVTQISGASVLDVDWDGDLDLIYSVNTGVNLAANTATGTEVRQVINTNTVADGTSLHLRIVDQNGVNTFFGNTVVLYDSAGNRVSSQILNPQSGVGVNDSTGLVHFYGLSATETYTAVLLRNVNGVSQDVGGLASLGTVTVENVNAGWTGLRAGASTSSLVLTAEADTAANNATVTGTGYNDVFIATQGNDTYRGGGGSTIVSGERVWSATGGQDVVDYRLAGTTAITVNLSNTGAQNTGFGTHTFVNVEGVAGAAGADVFTDSAADNLFNGRGGNDIFNLTAGGRDTLVYDLLDAADATGGNGVDVVNGFTVGAYVATPNADRIDLADLLTGYVADADGPARYVGGVATIDAGDAIADYLSVVQNGADAEIWIDRDGTGSAYTDTLLLTLTATTTDLETLLANQQIVVG